MRPDAVFGRDGTFDGSALRGVYLPRIFDNGKRRYNALHRLFDDRRNGSAVHMGADFFGRAVLIFTHSRAYYN